MKAPQFWEKELEATGADHFTADQLRALANVYERWAEQIRFKAT